MSFVLLVAGFIDYINSYKSWILRDAKDTTPRMNSIGYSTLRDNCNTVRRMDYNMYEIIRNIRIRI